MQKEKLGQIHNLIKRSDGSNSGESNSIESNEENLRKKRQMTNIETADIMPQVDQAVDVTAAATHGHHKKDKKHKSTHMPHSAKQRNAKRSKKPHRRTTQSPIA